MTTTINAYIGFGGDCTEAMNFYKECLGGELTLIKVKDTPLAEQCPAAMHEQIAHAMLHRDTMVLMGTDMVPPGGLQKGNNVALSVMCSSEEEINTLYEKLQQGGSILDPLKQQFWGAMFGVVTDKYGMCWMLNYDEKMASK